MPSRKLKRAAAKLLLVLVSVLVALSIAEVALRIAGYSFPTFYMPDDARGFALRPGAEGWYRKEGEAYVRVNSDGLRDREHSPQKPPDTIRIAVLGDSYAEALQVPQEAAFWSVLERRLKECGAFGGRDVEVINFGVSGYGTAQELITLREKVWRYAPDIVLLAVTTNNDITDNSRALKKMDEMPYFVFRDGRLVPGDSFRASRAFRLRRSALTRAGARLRDSSRVIQAFHHAQYALRNYLAARRARRVAQAGGAARDGSAAAHAATPRDDNAGRAQGVSAAPHAPADPAKAEDVGIDNLVYTAPADEIWADAWRVTEGLITLMRDEVESKGARLLVVTLSNAVQVYPEPAARAAFLRRVGADDLFYPDSRIRALCEREGIPVITLAPDLQRYADQRKTFLHGFGRGVGNGHWNAEGHRVAGELLAARLCAGALK